MRTVSWVFLTKTTFICAVKIKVQLLSLEKFIKPKINHVFSKAYKMEKRKTKESLVGNMLWLFVAK